MRTGGMAADEFWGASVADQDGTCSPQGRSQRACVCVYVHACVCLCMSISAWSSRLQLTYPVDPNDSSLSPHFQPIRITKYLNCTGERASPMENNVYQISSHIQTKSDSNLGLIETSKGALSGLNLSMNYTPEPWIVTDKELCLTLTTTCVCKFFHAKSQLLSKFASNCFEFCCILLLLKKKSNKKNKQTKKLIKTALSFEEKQPVQYNDNMWHLDWLLKSHNN